jgi:hypothetical protein
MMDRVLEVVIEEIREKRTMVTEAMARGAAKDFSEYQKLCGVIQGYSAIEGYILDLGKTMEYSDE